MSFVFGKARSLRLYPASAFTYHPSFMDEVRGWWVLVHFWPMIRGFDHPVTDDREGRRPPAVAGQFLDPSGMISWRPFQNPSALSETRIAFLNKNCNLPARVAFLCRKSAASVFLVFFFWGVCFCEVTDRARNALPPSNVANGAIEGRGSVVRNQ